MAEAAKEKKTRKSGPRVAKPIYVLVSYTDEDGNAVALDSNRLKIEAVKDPTQVIQRILQGGMDGVAFTSFTPGADRASPAA